MKFLNIAAINKLKWREMKMTQTDSGGGIYRLYNLANEVIYVGKTNDLHRRLLQHYNKKTNTSYFIDEVSRHEVLPEENHILRTLLEGIFIFLHKPKYNDEVKDEKERTNEN